MSVTASNQQALTDGLVMALKLIMEMTPSHREGVNLIVGSIKNQQSSPEEIAFNIKRISNNILQERDRSSLAQRLSLEKIEKQSERLLTSEHLSAPQAESIEALLSNIQKDTHIVLSQLSNTYGLFANETIRRRSEDDVIVGPEHQRLKKRENNIIAGDVAWSSRNIVSSVHPLLRRISKSNPHNNKIKSLYEKCSTLKENKVTDFFEAILLLDESLKEILRIHNNKGEGDSDYLKTVQKHLARMHEQIEKTIDENSVFCNSSKKEREALELLVKNFKKSAENEDDPAKLKSIITDNINNLSNGFEKILSRQDSHIRAQQHVMSNLRSEVRTQKKNNAALIKEREETQQHIKEAQGLSLVDPLTGWQNRRAYESAIQKIDQQIKNAPTPEHYGIIVIDIDHFKSLNDKYGHNIGDKVLKSVCDNIKKFIGRLEKLNEKLSLFRYGGEEFALVYKGVPPKTAVSIADSIRKKINNLDFQLKKESLSVSLSVGVSHYRKEEKLGSNVFVDADKAMYFSKKNGRNRVTYFDPRNGCVLIKKKEE